MAESPDKMEELLQRYAKERREQGGGFELHPATRRLLQGEVARQYGAGEAKGGAKRGFGSWLGSLGGWLTLGGSVAAAVLFGIWMLGPASPPEATMQLAKNDDFGDEVRLMERAELRPESDFKELKKEEAAVAASGSLTPVQNVPADVRAKDSSELASIVPKQKAESLYAVMPGAEPAALGQPADKSFGVTLDDSTMRQDQASGAGASPAAGRSRFTATSGDRVAQKPAPVDALALAAQPQVAVAFDGGVAGGTGLGAADQPVALARGANNLTTTAPAAPAPAADAFDAERKMSATVAESRSRSLVAVSGAASATGPRAAGTKANAMFFHRQGTTVPQAPMAEALVRTAQPEGVTRLQSSPAIGQAAAPEVLSEFTVEVDGDTIRLTDSDQSVYEGVISNEATVVENEASKARNSDLAIRIERQAVAKTAAPVSSGGREFYFRAAGSNASLKQLVILSGRMGGVAELAASGPAPRGGAALAPAVPVPPATTAPNRGAPAPPTTAAPATTASNLALTIEGTVQVGGTNEQRFRAYRVVR